MINLFILGDIFLTVLLIIVAIVYLKTHRRQREVKKEEIIIIDDMEMVRQDIKVVKNNNRVTQQENPITKEELDEIIQKDRELAWSEKDYVAMTDKNGQVTRYYAIKWNNIPCFLWYKNEILCSKADERQIVKLVEIANKLGAKVRGYDGNTFNVGKDKSGKIFLTYH